MKNLIKPETEYNVTFYTIVSVLGLIFASFSSNSLASAETQKRIYPEKYEKLYIDRLKALFEGQGGQNGGFSYDPLLTVQGADELQALPSTTANIPNSINQSALNSVNEYAARQNSQALYIWHKGKMHSTEFFNGANKETLIVGRSLAKPITVTAVGRAIQDGYIESIEQPVSDFIGEWKNTDRAGITIRHLLEMRSGLLKQSFSKDPKDILNRTYLHPYHAEIIINEYPLTHEPGTRYDYSNANAELIAPLIERATGKKYQDWISEEVFKPLGALGGKIWVNRPNGMVHAGCCILLPADTFFRIGLLSYFKGRWGGKQLLPNGYIKKTKTASAQNKWSGMAAYLGQPYTERRGAANPDINVGKTYHSEPYLAQDLYLFDGNAHQVIYIVPSEELVVMRVGNPPPRDTPWDNAFIPNTLIRGIIR